MSLAIRCVDEAQPVPRDVVWEFSCDGLTCGGGLFPPPPESFLSWSDAMAAGWKETYRDGARVFLGPCCSGKSAG